MINKSFIFIFLCLCLIPLACAELQLGIEGEIGINFEPAVNESTTIITGNLTNLSQMQDVNGSGWVDNYFLQWDSAEALWQAVFVSPGGGGDNASWNESYAKEIFCQLVGGAGCDMQGDILMNNNSLIDVHALGFNDGQNITWNANDYTIDVPTGLGPVNQVGQEDYEIVYNNLGVTAENGQVIYWDSNANDRPTIGLAYSEDQTISEKTIGFLTMDIANGTEGIAVTRGRIRDLNTSACVVGETVYLDPYIPGSWTPTRPSEGNFIIVLGMICKVGVTDGEICARNAQLISPNDLNGATGFPEQNAIPKQSDANFTNADRTFRISPNVAGGYNTFYIWQLGSKYVFNSTQSTTIPDEEGAFYIYFNQGNLTYLKDPTDGQVGDLIRNNVTVAIVYWDADANEAKIIGDERHGHVMSSDTHAYLHFSRGTEWISGLTLSDIIADASGDLNTSAQFGVDSGVITDEDLINIIGTIDSGAGLPIFYLSGSGADLRRISNPNFSVITFDGTPSTRLAYNNPDAGGIGVWGISQVASTDFVLAHIFATNSKQDPVISFMGQADYNTITAARAGAVTEISVIQTNYPQPELVPLATVIFQTRDTYNNGVKGRIRTTDEGFDYVDWRQAALIPGASPAAHPNLAALSWVGSGHRGTAETIAGFDGSGLATEYFLNSTQFNISNSIININQSWLFTLFYTKDETYNKSEIDANITNAVGSIRGSIVIVNLTTATYNGDTGGYNSSNQICDSEYPGSALCTEFEVINWFNYRGSGTTGDAWVSTGSPKYIPANVPVNDCNGWTYSGTSTYLGNYWHFNVTEGGDGRAINCGTSLKLACCTYV